MDQPLPAIFFGHGNPMNALQHNDYSRGWAAIGAGLPRPRAILSISAHWYIPSTQDYETLGRDALLSVPTPDHYLPLLYVLALRRAGEPISYPVEGVDGGSVSMLAIQIGG